VAELMGMSETGRIAWLEAHLWPHEARMIAAVADGVRSVDPHARFSTHLSGITSVISTQAVAFYKAMERGGFQADKLGVSYYPTFSASVASVRCGRSSPDPEHRSKGRRRIACGHSSRR